MTQGIYKILNTVTGEFYIGSSVNIEQRWQQHKSMMRSTIKHGIYPRWCSIRMMDAAVEHGVESFILEILEEYPDINRFVLRTREWEWARKLKPTLNSALPSEYVSGGFAYSRQPK